jgi:hypothetical protein
MRLLYVSTTMKKKIIYLMILIFFIAIIYLLFYSYKYKNKMFNRCPGDVLHFYDPEDRNPCRCNNGLGYYNPDSLNTDSGCYSNMNGHAPI